MHTATVAPPHRWTAELIVWPPRRKLARFRLAATMNWMIFYRQNSLATDPRFSPIGQYKEFSIRDALRLRYKIVKILLELFQRALPPAGPVSVDKDGNVIIKVHAKPGAKQNNITGKLFLRMKRLVELLFFYIRKKRKKKKLSCRYLGGRCRRCCFGTSGRRRS